MKRSLRKLLAVGLTVAVVLCVGVCMPGLAQDGLLFSDDFSANSSLSERGWDSDSGAVENGKLALTSAQGYKRVTLGKNWTDYTLSATVVMQGTASANLAAAGISARTTGDNNGYEYAITYRKKNGETGVRLYARNGGGEVASKTVAFDPFVPHTLKMQVVGNQITCYLDGADTPVLQYTDTASTARLNGSVAVRNSGVTAVYDDVQVQTYREETSSEQSSAETSSTTSAPDTDVLFYDDFTANSLLTERGWDTGDGVVDGAILKLTAEQGYKQVADGKNWTNYTAAVETRMVSGDTTASLSTAGISVRTTSSENGYEFSLTYRRKNGETGLRLYERGGAQLDSKTLTLDPFAFHVLRVSVVGDTLYCYLDGETQPIFTYQGVGRGSGSVALRNTGLSAEYGSLLVREISDSVSSAPTSSTPASSTPTSSTPTSSTDSSTTSSDSASSGGQTESKILYSNDFSRDMPLQQQGFTASVGSIANGALTLPSAQGHGILAAGTLWTDYVASADVQLLPEDTDSNSVYAGLTVRSVSSSTGYEFALLVTPKNQKTQIRLYNRHAKKTLATLEREYDPQIPHNLKVVAVGNRIECYLDYEAEPSIVYTDTDATARLIGSVGLTNKQYSGVYDRFLVVRATEADLAAEAQPPMAQNGVYFADNFNGRASLMQEGWGRENLTIADQKLVLSVAERSMYLDRNSGFSLLSDYTVRADVSIDALQVLNGVSIGSANLVGRSTGGNGYEFGIFVNDAGTESYVRLYDRTSGKTLAINQDVSVVRGQTYTLKMVMQGQKIRCFLNQEKVLEVEDSANPLGTAGVRVGGYTGYYDNFTVCQNAVEDLEDRPSAQVPDTGESASNIGIFFALGSVAILVVCRKRKQGI